MAYRIQTIELYMRETPPNRVSMSIGRMGSEGTRSTSPIAHVRMIVRDSAGNETFGCAADRLSVRWLDKRPDREQGRKLRELVKLVYDARDIYRSEANEFETPFAEWQARHPRIVRAGKDSGQEELTSAFASALFERAMLDAVHGGPPELARSVLSRRLTRIRAASPAWRGAVPQCMLSASRANRYDGGLRSDSSPAANPGKAETDETRNIYPWRFYPRRTPYCRPDRGPRP
jgi:hypothetical protein